MEYNINIDQENTAASDTYFSLPQSLVCTFDLEGSIKEVNTYFREILGYTLEDVQALTLHTLVHTEDLEVTQNEIKKLSTGKIALNFENRCRCKDGSYRWLSWIGRHDKKTDLYYVIGRDVTEEKNTRKKLETLLETKEKLFSILGHDLKGSMEGIRTMSELLQDDVRRGAEAKSLLKGLQLIGHTAGSTHELLDNQLQWFFLQLESFKPGFREFDIRRCITNAVNIYLSAAANKQITINMDIPGMRLSGDWNLLSIVFRNLISNAIKFSEPDSEVTIEAEETENHIEISVRDQGIGIPEKLKARLFDPDDRPMRPGTGHEQSTGLGLLLCSEIVAMHRGDILVESEENMGSSFTIILPTRQNA